MTVKVDIFYPRLKALIDEPDTLELEGSTVGECLDDLLGRFSGAAKLLFDDGGVLLKHIFIYVNAESVYKAAMDAPIKKGDKLIIAALILGG